MPPLDERCACIAGHAVLTYTCVNRVHIQQQAQYGNASIAVVQCFNLYASSALHLMHPSLCYATDVADFCWLLLVDAVEVLSMHVHLRRLSVSVMQDLAFVSLQPSNLQRATATARTLAA